MTEIKKWFTRLEVKPVNTSSEIEDAMLSEIDDLRVALAQQSMQLAHDLVTIECLNDKVMRLLNREPMTIEAIRKVGGIVHKDGNIFFY